MARRKPIWRKGEVVMCPCCHEEYETDSYIPFSQQQYDLHLAAVDLFEACKASLSAMTVGNPTNYGELYELLSTAIAKAKGYEN